MQVTRKLVTNENSWNECEGSHMGENYHTKIQAITVITNLSAVGTAILEPFQGNNAKQNVTLSSQTVHEDTIPVHVP
jgi:hypothetical protein